MGFVSTAIEASVAESIVFLNCFMKYGKPFTVTGHRLPIAAKKAAELSDLPEDLLNIPHNPEKSSQTEIEYRLAWVRTYLKKTE